jgi:amino acid transporter
MNVLFLVAMIVEFIFAVLYLLFPGPIFSQFGLTLDATSMAIARMFGSALLAFPVLLWYASRSDNSDFKRSTVKTLFTYNLVVFILLIITQTSGLVNTFGWGGVILHLIFVLWFGYYLVKKA